MHWIPILLLAIALEVTATTCMKLSDGFAKIVPSALMFIFYGMSFVCLTFVLRKVDVGVAYALWSAIGTALVALVGILLFKEAMTPLKVVSLVLIIAGVVGMRLSEGRAGQSSGPPPAITD